MAAAIFALTTALILFAGAGQIETLWLALTQFALAVIFTISGAGAGWVWARER